MNNLFAGIFLLVLLQARISDTRSDGSLKETDQPARQLKMTTDQVVASLKKMMEGKATPDNNTFKYKGCSLTFDYKPDDDILNVVMNGLDYQELELKKYDISFSEDQKKTDYERIKKNFIDPFITKCDTIVTNEDMKVELTKNLTSLVTQYGNVGFTQQNEILVGEAEGHIIALKLLGATANTPFSVVISSSYFSTSITLNPSTIEILKEQIINGLNVLISQTIIMDAYMNHDSDDVVLEIKCEALNSIFIETIGEAVSFNIKSECTETNPTFLTFEASFGSAQNKIAEGNGYRKIDIFAKSMYRTDQIVKALAMALLNEATYFNQPVIDKASGGVSAI